MKDVELVEGSGVNRFYRELEAWISRLNDECNYTRIANFQLDYSQLGYLDVLFAWMPVIGYGAIRGPGG